MEEAGGQTELPELAVERAVRAELRRRAGKGAFLYPVVAAVLLWFTPLGADRGWLGLVFLVGLTLLAAARKAAAAPDEGGRRFGSDRQLALMVPLQALVWGTFTAVIFLWQGLSTVTWLALISSAGMAAGGTAAMGIHPNIHRPFLAGLAVPVIVTTALVKHEVWLPLSIVSACFVWFLRRDARQHAERFADLVRTQHALRIARDQARSADQSKSAFLAMMSHEIRTPMHAVLGTASMLLESELDPRQRRHLTTLTRAGENLVGLINDALDFTRIDAHGLQLEQEEFELGAAFDEVTQMLEPLADKAELNYRSELAFAGPLWVCADRRRVQQVFINLLGNAIKFTEQGEVRLEASATAVGERVLLRAQVCDTGIGIAEEQLSRIFDPFEQGEVGSRRKFGGSGLGLCICRLLVEGMGGRISVQSAAGQGTAFAVELDFPRGEGKPATDDASAAGGGSFGEIKPSLPEGTRVLVVDDSALNRELAAEMLSQLGCCAELAEGGTAALALFREQSFHIVLMDCQMDDMDGYETTRQIRSLGPEGAQVPVVAVTANVFDEDRRRALDSGMNDVLPKPFGLRDLEATIRRWLDSAELGPISRPPTSRPAPARGYSLYPQAARHVACLLRVESGTERADRIVGAFLSQWPQRLAAMESALRDQDAEGIRDVLHTLAGSVPFLGIDELDERLRRLHELAREGDLAACGHALARLSRLVDELDESRARHLGQAQGA